VAAADLKGLRSLTRRVSLGGMLTAVALAAVIAAFYSPTADIALYSLASLCTAIAVIELGFRGGIAVYLAASLLGLAFPGLAAVMPLIVFFGPYPLARAFADSRLARTPAFWVRLLAGNVLAALSVILFAWEPVSGLAEKTGLLFWPALIIGAEAFLLVYDFALGLLISLYITRIRRKISPPASFFKDHQ
jgi:hypothetical protein